MIALPFLFRKSSLHRSFGPRRALLFVSLLTGVAPAPLPALAGPGDQGDTLALVGPSVITSHDLIERIELMPWQGKENPASHDSAKIQALQSMVAEELLAMEAAAAGAGSDPSILARTREVERLMVRDALYRSEVTAKVTVSAEELERGLRRYGRQLTLLALNTRDRTDAQMLSGALTASSSPDSVLHALSGSLVVRTDTARVALGRLEEPFEDAAFALTPDKPASGILMSPRGGWFVFYLVGISPDPSAAGASPGDRRFRVEQILRQRKETLRAREYMAAVLESERASVDPELFDRLARTALMTLRSAPPEARTAGGYSLSIVIDAVMDQLAEELPKTFVTLRNGEISLQDILATYRYINFLFPTLEERDFRSRLNGTVKEAVATEIMAREGYRLGLQHTGEVRHDVGAWTRYWLAGMMQEKIAAGAAAGEEEVLRYIVDRAATIGRLYEVNIREVLSDSLDRALTVLDRLMAGEDLGELAWRYSRRAAWAVRRGESGFFRVSEHPEIGVAALAADTGKLIGPTHTREGYSVFRVLGKRPVAGEHSPPLDSLFGGIRAALSWERARSSLNRFLADQARSYGVRLYYERLRKVTIMPSNMVTRRFIGFGGSMIAVPGLTPRWEWIYESEALKDLLP